MKNRISLLLSSMLFIFPASALSISEAFQFALENDLTFKQAKHQLLADRSSNRSEWGAILPQVVLNYGASATQSKIQENWNSTPRQNVLSLRLSQTLFDVSMFANLYLAEKKRQQSEIVYLQAKQDLIQRVVKSYTDLLSAYQQVVNSEKELDASARAAKTARSKYTVGAINQTDMNLAIAEENKNKANLLLQTSNLETAKLKLQNITGLQNIDSINDIKSDDFIRQLPYQEYDVEKVLNDNLTIKSLYMAVNLAETGVAISSSTFLPTVSFSATWSSAPSTNNLLASGVRKNFAFNNKQLMLNISLPLFSGFRSVNGITQALATKDKVVESYNQGRQQLSTAYRSLLNGMTVNRESLAALAISISALEKASNNAYKTYTESFVAIQTVLDATKSYYAVKSQYEASLYNYVNNYLTLQMMDNTLTEDIFQQLDKVFQVKTSLVNKSQ